MSGVGSGRQLGEEGRAVLFVDEEAEADGVGCVLGVQGGGSQNELFGDGKGLIIAVELVLQSLGQLPGEAAVDLSDLMDFGVLGRPGGDDLGVPGHHIIGVHEIDRSLIRNVIQDRRPPADVQLVPAHVGDLEPGHLGEVDYLAGKKIETLVFTILIALAEQELQAQTDSEKRLARLNMRPQGLIQLRLAQPGDGVTEGADSRQDDFLRFSNPVGVAADFGLDLELL